MFVHVHVHILYRRMHETCQIQVEDQEMLCSFKL